ncbi:MAG: cytochrome P450 [Rhodospirillaceae bacterium]|nr:cytochrome P450 [Rhodospirillaceae bacterium]
MAASINLLDPLTFCSGHPHAVYDALRAEAPVYFHPGSDKQPSFWVLTRYDDVVAVSRNNTQFSSARGFRLPTDRKLDLAPEVRASLANTILALDPPKHMDFRKLLNPSFMPSALKNLEQALEIHTDELIGSLCAGETIEFVENVAAIIPIKAICRILGVPQEDEDKVFEWTNRLVGTDDPEYSPTLEQTNAAFQEVFSYSRWLLQKRKADPQNDLLTTVACAEIDGKSIDDATRDGFCMTLLAAGNETTRNSLTGSIWALTNNRDARSYLNSFPEKLPETVDEFVRHITPVIQMMRTALEDVVVGGQVIKAGERVVMLYGAANRDPAVFSNPHQLDLTRENAKKHLAFGIGIHHCLGAKPAAMQIRSILSRLLQRFPNIEAVEEPIYMGSNFVMGFKKLKVKLH